MNAPRPPSWREVLLVAAGGLLLSVCATWPLATELFSARRVADDTLDDLVLVWNCWWAHEALVVEHRMPWFCDRIFVPQGASMVASPFMLPLTLFSLPLQAVAGTLEGSLWAVKGSAFLSFVVAVLGAHGLMRWFGARPGAAFLAATWFAFVPFRLVHLTRVHYLAGALTPLFLLCFLEAVRSGRWNWRVAGMLCLALAGSLDASSLPEIALFGGVLWCVMPGAPALVPRVTRAGSVVLGGTLLLAPLLVPFLMEVRDNPGVDVVERLRFHDQPLRNDLFNSPDLNNLGFYLSPSLHEQLPEDGELSMGAAGTRAVLHAFRPPGPLPELEALAAGLAATAVLLCFVLGLGRPRRSLAFALLAGLGLVLALGPYRQWGDEVVRMPYYWLSRAVPGMSAARYAASFLRVFFLGVAVVGALGLGRGGAGLRGACVAVLILVAAAWCSRPFVFRELELEPCHALMRDDPDPGVVLELPHRGETSRKRMALGQIVHGRATCNGPLSRVSDETWAFHRDLPLVRRLEHPPARPRPEVLAVEVPENLAILREHDIRFLVLRRLMWGGDPARRAPWQAYLEAHPGLEVRLTPRGHLLAKVLPEASAPR